MATAFPTFVPLDLDDLFAASDDLVERIGSMKNANAATKEETAIIQTRNDGLRRELVEVNAMRLTLLGKYGIFFMSNTALTDTVNRGYRHLTLAIVLMLNRSHANAECPNPPPGKAS